MKFNLGLDKENYRIDFVLSGKRKRFYPGTSDELKARNILRRMEFDWEQGQFDATLQSYKLKNRVQFAKVEPYTSKQVGKSNTKLLTLWDKWVESLNLPLRTLNDHYHCCRVMVAKANSSWNDTSWFVQSDLAASTWNTRRRFIKSCITWALAEGLIEGKNPWNGLKSRKVSRTGANPLTKAETQLIIQSFEDNRFCALSSPCKHSYYLPYLKFLLHTAARPGEVIALQWKHIDFENNLIEISEAMGKDLEASPYATRKIRKETKTGETRYLPISPALKELLLGYKPVDARPDSLVFTGARGKSVLDIRAFREVWKKVLDGLGLEYRKPYQTRHTALSHIAQNHGLLAAAQVAGHKSLDMVSRHYVKFTGDLNDVMPDFR
jgi:integrase